jgi:hypothetical protein
MKKRRKPLVSQDQAWQFASAFISQQDLKGWRFDVAEAHRAAIDPDNWTVIVDRFSPEGELVDGPQILIVNGATGEVRFFEDHY